MESTALMEYLRKNDHFLRELGAVITRCEPGRAEIELELEAGHMTDVGRRHAHAGVIYSLAESASAAAVLAYGWNAMAVEGNVSYIGAAASGKLRATARAKDAHEAESGSCRVTVYGEEDAVVAKANFTIVYTGGPFEA